MDYKEKLEEAKRLYETANADQRYVLESLFPELKESEDEKIRKVLIDYFKRYKEQEECGIKTFYGIPTDNILAWLEKQGEQKPAWSEEDEKELNSCIEAIEACYEWDTMVDWLKSLKNRVIPQPKHSWSEEDEITLDTLFNLVKMYHGDCIDMPEKNRLLNCLIALKGRIGE